jgi:hypothetical protein
VDGGAITTQRAGDLADAKPHLHQTAQATSLLKREVAVIGSQGEPGIASVASDLRACEQPGNS